MARNAKGEAQLGTDDLDTLRRTLHERADRLLAATGAPALAELAAAAERLSAAARPLFDEEERLLRETESLTLERHAREHARFLADLAGLADAAIRGDRDAVAAVRPAAWLASWLAAHGRTDRELPGARNKAPATAA